MTKFKDLSSLHKKAYIVGVIIGFLLSTTVVSILMVWGVGLFGYTLSLPNAFIISAVIGVLWNLIK